MLPTGGPGHITCSTVNRGGGDAIAEPWSESLPEAVEGFQLVVSGSQRLDQSSGGRESVLDGIATSCQAEGAGRAESPPAI